MRAPATSSSAPPARDGRPRPAVLIAIAAVAGALAFAVGQQTPLGRLEGNVLDARNAAPLAGAQVVLTPAGGGEARPRLIYAATDGSGRFALAHVPAGVYQIAAYRDTFAVEEETVRIEEGRTSSVTLRLAFSRPHIQLVGPRRHFAAAEAVRLPVRGYVETGSAPSSRVILMRLYRSRLSELLRDRRAAEALSFGAGWRPTGGLPDAVLRPPGAPQPVLVAEHRVPITEAGIEGFYTKTLDAGRLPPGLYLVEARYSGAAVSTWLLVSDTALVLKRAPGQALAFVVDARTGAPVAGSRVRLHRGGAVVAQGTTSADGLARMPVPNDLDTAYLLAVAQRGDDEAVVGRTEYNAEGGGPFTLHAYTDRPIYRPGQRIYFKGIVRRTVSPGEAYTVPAGQPVAVELRDPDGEPVLRQRFTTNAFGSFFGRADLSPEAPTGPYALILTAADSTALHDVVVAAYRKPEFSVTVSPAQPRYVRGDPVRVEVSAQFYFGAPVAGAAVTYSIYRTPDWYGEYLALYGEEPDPDDESYPGGYDGYGEAVGEGEARLDDQGRTVLTFHANVPATQDGPQDQIFSVQVAVTDQSGRGAAGEGSVRVTAGDFRLAVRPEGTFVEPGRPAPVMVLVRDAARRPVPGVRVTLEASYERWDPARREYVGAPFDTRELTAGEDGTATVALTLPRSGAVQLRALARDARGRAIRTSTWLWVADASTADLGMRYTDLSLQTDRRRYRPGETARVLLNANEVGPTALLTIEGARIHRVLLVPIRQRTTVVAVPILAEYGPNVVLSALYVKDRQLARGDVGLSVAVPQRELAVAVRTDRPTYGPGERATYTVEITDPEGRPQQAEFSLAVVDEAIYALREDNPRALRDAFYPRRWNMVRTSYSLELWYLGDADKGEISTALRRRFEDTAGWYPALATDARGRAAVTLTLPDNLTTWRATVLAHTQDTRLGRAVHTVTVSRPFFVRVETPRVFSQRDRSRVLVMVHNETDAPAQATVRLEAEGLDVEGPAERPVALAPRRAQPVSWEVVAQRPGDATVRVAARTTAQPAHADGVELTVPVRPHGRTQITSRAGDLTAGAPATETVELDARAVAEASHVEVRLTPSVTRAAVGALEYLIGYPYGCVEQTMSRFLPTVLVQRVLREGGLPQGDLDTRIPAMVRDGLTRLYRSQNEGGWGWWEFGDRDAWMTAYVLYGLATARAEGFPVRATALEAGRRAALALVDDARDPDTRIFLLYAVALAGDPDGAGARRTRLGLSGLRPEGLAYTVLLDRLVGRDPRPAFDALMRGAVAEDGLLHWPSADRWDWNDRMATALGLRAVLAVDPTDPRVERVVRWLMLRRTESHWGSTRDTSWVLAALADYLRRERDATPSGEVRVLLNGRLLETVPLETDRDAPPAALRVPASALRPGRNDITLERAGGGSRVFYTVTLRQVVAADTFPALSPVRIQLAREYLRLVPQRSGGGSLQPEPTRNELRQGDRVLVRLTITAPTDLPYVIIEDPFPAGFEATERGRAEVETDGWYWWWDYTDVRDDRIAIFARQVPAGTHVIEYNLRAQTPGTYQAFPAVLQGMYAPRLRAETSGVRVVIR